MFSWLKKGKARTLNKRIFSARLLTLTAMTAALYAALTLVFAPISFGESLIEFRISEILNMLVFVNPVFAPGIVLGCFIANIFSPIGALDMIVGTLGSLISARLMIKCGKNMLAASLCPAIGNIIVGFPIAAYLAADPAFGQYHFWFLFLWGAGAVVVGEIAVVTVGGNILFRLILKNKYFKSFLQNIGGRNVE